MNPDEIRRKAAGIRLAAIDIDGTCLKSNKELTGRTQKAMQALIDGGIMVVPATGRGYAMQMKEGNILPLEGIKYLLMLDGAIVTESDSGNEIWKKSIVKSEAARFAEEALIPGNRVGINFDDGGETRLSASCDGNFGSNYNNRRSSSLNDAHSVENITADIGERILSDSHDVLKISLSLSGPEKIGYYKDIVAERYPGMTAYRADTTFMEFTAAETSKGIALEKLAGYLGIGPDEIFAVGDCENDISMIRYAGLGVAMGNALDDVKESADLVIGTNNDEGLAAFLEEYFL